MEIGKDCEPYLQSREVTKILQQQNSLLHKKVFDCLRKFRQYFYSIVPLQHYLIAEDILLMCAEDAFATTETMFLEQVRNNDFRADTTYCLPYFKTIFKRNYFKLYLNEIRRKNLGSVVDEADLHSYNEGEGKLLKKDLLTLKVDALLNELSEEDKKTYKMVYVEKLTRTEIADLLKILPEAVSTKIWRFHQRFSEIWKNKK